MDIQKALGDFPRWIGLMLVLILVSACGPTPTEPPPTAQPTEPTAPPTATPTVLPAPTDTPIPPPTAVPEGNFQPLEPAACGELAAVMAQELGVEVTMAEAAFHDYIGGEGGTGCQMTATGTGVDFENFSAVADDLGAILTDRAWQEDIMYAADGPTGTGSGWRKDSGLCLLVVGWEPSADADCPQDKPISECELAPEQQLYTIVLNCAQIPATAVATSVPATVEPTAVSVVPTATPEGSGVVCTEVPIRGFGKVWAEHVEMQQGLGCPYTYYYCYGGDCSGEQVMVSAVQRFEHGTMIWVNQPTWEGTRWVYVLFEDGTYQRFPDTFEEGVDPESDPDIVPPEGLYQPIRGFGKVWREGTGAQVRERLGWAIEPEQGGDGAWQAFERGMMYWIGPVLRIYVIYEYDADYNRVNNYQEFTDTFAGD